MPRILAALALAASLLPGCASRQRYVEGTHLALGAYLPTQDGLYGVELLQYVNGAVLNTGTNTPCVFSREYSATNSYLWGACETRESTRTRLEIKTQ